ncbi:GatB/YqeY domain-containing protein [Thiohalorhabdus sp. Cl-TMA]|uniref:GatB/YqeY domain-containing protein n=1 Tax=Thiohalorhabdus methylotrophus TaxID=3242694 RepID=A0ABV4TRS8_9GAMM
MTLKDRINDDTKAAMRAKDKARLGTLRMLSSALKDAEIKQGEELAEPDQLALINKLIKQRRDSAEQYRDAGREEQAAAEEAEAEVLAEYLPPALSQEEVDAAIDEAISESGASGPQDMGSVMGRLKGKLQGRADLGAVSQRVKERLGS